MDDDRMNRVSTGLLGHYDVAIAVRGAALGKSGLRVEPCCGCLKCMETR
jgi:hypothetical protein